jgi:hypothetical protein
MDLSPDAREEPLGEGTGQERPTDAASSSNAMMFATKTPDAEKRIGTTGDTSMIEMRTVYEQIKPS